MMTEFKPKVASMGPQTLSKSKRQPYVLHNGQVVYSNKELTLRDEFVHQHKKNGLFERLYNGIKNLTGLGTGSKKVKSAIAKAEKGEICEDDARKAIDKYRKSQLSSAQAFGDLLSVGAAGITYFGLRNEAKKQYNIIQLNKKFGAKKNHIIAMLENTKGTWKEKLKKGMITIVAKVAGSKTKLAVFTATVAGLVGGFTKYWALKFNRIGSEEFKYSKKDYNGAESPYDKMAYKMEKKDKKSRRRGANFRNFASGVVNGLLMPVSVLGKAFVGIPAYLVGNSLNRYFVGNHEEKNKNINGYVENLKNDGITHLALATTIAIPLAKNGRFSAIFDQNLEKSFNKLMQQTELKNNPYAGKTAYKELEEILLGSDGIRDLVENTNHISIEERIKSLTNQNIFAVKFKQIQRNGDNLTKALQENCPSTRTLEEAALDIKTALGDGYQIISNMGTGTVAETYLAKDKNGKEVCIKILKKGINAEKILKDKNAFIDIINNLEGKSDAEKKYLIKNVEDLAEGILKEVDLANEMQAAQKLVNYTKTANVVRPIEVKNGVYVMEKAEGLSFKKLLEINNIDSWITDCKNQVQNSVDEKDRKMFQELLDAALKEKAEISSKYKDIILSEKDADYMIDEYMKVLVEQLYKTDASGRTIHADIHPGNIFIDVNALKARKGKIFTLIDTGNTIDLTAQQAERSMKLTQYIERGDTKDLAKYFIDDADLSSSKLNKEQALKKMEEELNKIFFDSETRLGTLNNTEIINLTSNIMKKYDIMPGGSQLNLEKARTSAKESFETLLNLWFNEAGKNIERHDNKGTQIITALGKVNKALGKIDEYEKLQQIQEKRNLLQLIKSPKEFFKKNPNYKASNSEEYLTYHLKQGITDPKNKLG